MYDSTKPIVAKLTNHPNTVTDELLATMNARHAMSEGTATQYMGIPAFVHVLKIFGACSSSAREYRVLEALYRYAFPQLQADRRIRKLIKLGRPSMPKFWIPITQGEAADPTEPLLSAPSKRGSLLEQMIPTAKTPTI